MTHKPHNDISVTTYALTDVGHIRSQQEDSLGYVNIPTGKNQRGHLYVLADGVATSAEGELASSLAVQLIIKTYYTIPTTNVESALKNAILRANRRIREKSAKRNTTTVVCAALHGNTLHVAHLGDSRAYFLSKGNLKRLTSDHSVVQQLIDEEELTEEEAKTHPDRNVITRSLGNYAQVEPTINSFPIEPGDVLLLCSDGLHDELSDETIQRLLIDNTNLESAGAALVEQANLSSGRDNISLIVTGVDRIESISHSDQEHHLPALQLDEINHWAYARLASTKEQEIKFSDINSDPKAPSVDSDTSQQAEAKPSERRQLSRLLGIVIMLLAVTLMIQTIWFHGELNKLDQVTPTQPFLTIPSPIPTMSNP